MERRKKDLVEVVRLKKTDDIYYHIQGLLHILQKDFCLFGIWTCTQHKMYVEKIERDVAFFSKMKDRLTSFYHDWLLPELIDPRLKRNMEIRVPLTTEQPCVEQPNIQQSND